MRITSGMVMDNYLKSLNKNMSSMVDIQYQMSTGKRLNKMSDDPVDAMSIMQYRVKLYKSEQYKQNVDNGLTWLEQTESSVSELNEVLKSAYETVIETANDYLNSDDRKAAAELIGQLRDHILTIGNAQSGSQYIFGGYNTNKAPFSVDGSGKPVYNGLDLTDGSNAALIAESETSIEYEVGFNLKMSVSVNGAELLGTGDDNIYTVLDNLYNALNSDASATEISAYADKLQDSQSQVLSVLADIGGRVNRLELLSNRYDEDNLLYTDRNSKLEDVDQAEAIMNYKMSEYVYNAALQIGSKIVQPSLVDFLK
jgi:flagellar hook-associated protein 3 FlgL